MILEGFGPVRPGGYSPSCPHCGERDAWFSAGLGTWVCNKCGLYGAPVEDWYEGGEQGAGSKT